MNQTATIPALRNWSTTRTHGQVSGHTLTVAGLGTLSIALVFPAGGVIPTGWALKVSPALPYGVTATPYQLDQVDGLKSAAKLVKAAQAYAGDRSKQLAVKQACLNA